MPVITLTSDWGWKDPYRGAVEGAILSRLPQAVIVDVSHDILPFDLSQAAFIIRNTFRNFPEGSVHLIGINSEASPETPHTLIRSEGHFFIGADTGIFSLLFDDPPDLIVELDIRKEGDSFTFPERDVFVKAACHVIQGLNPEDLGRRKSSVVTRMAFQPVISNNLIRGKVIFVDRYGNAYVNITEKLFRSLTANRKFVITFRSSSYQITSISRSYRDEHEGEMLALFSTSGYLEIAINRGDAGNLLGLRPDTSVVVEILDAGSRIQ